MFINANPYLPMDLLFAYLLVSGRNKDEYIYAMQLIELHAREITQA